MKIFISWSGERSHQVAELLSDWLQCVLQAANPWLSSKDIDRGSIWFSEITAQLSDTQNGIVCLTKANMNKPWILFEAGALAKGLSTNRVYTFLIDLKTTDIQGPLSQFNHTTPVREDVYQLVSTINRGLASPLNESILSSVFETYWPQFEERFKQIVKTTTDEEVVFERADEDILSEILDSVRGIDKRLRSVERLEGNINYNRKISNVLSDNIRRNPIDMSDISIELAKVLNENNIHNINDLLESNSKIIENLNESQVKQIKKLINKHKSNY